MFVYVVVHNDGWEFNQILMAFKKLSDAKDFVVARTFDPNEAQADRELFGTDPQLDRDFRSYMIKR